MRHACGVESSPIGPALQISFEHFSNSSVQDVVSADSETRDDGEAPAARRRGPDPPSHRRLHQPVPRFGGRLQRAVPRKPHAVRLRLQRRAEAEAARFQTRRERETLTLHSASSMPGVLSVEETTGRG